MTSRSPSDRSPSIRLPSSGHAALGLFQLAPDLVHLNHGSYGAVPREVQAEQDRWRALIEADATGFFQDVYPAEIRHMAGVAAAQFGGAGHDWVFCENATAAVNSVLASFSLKAGDEILTTSHAYGAVTKAMRLWADRRGATLQIAELPSFLDCDDQILEGVTAAFTQRTRLLVVDHITSPTAVIFPAERLARAARERGIAVLIDGAHAPGQVPLEVPAIGADWYTGNAHKWFFAPKGCGLLWTHPSRQEITRPAVLSHGTEQGYIQAFDWIGTRDTTPWLSFDASSRAHEMLGGASLIARNQALAAEAAELLADSLSAPISAPASMRGAMASLCLDPLGGDPEAARLLRLALRKTGIVAPVSAFAGGLWIRISAQIYNEIGDYRRCARTLAELRPARDSHSRIE
jgi:isopenicillin-N epimerase